MAQWVFRMEMQSDYGVFDGLLDDYRPLLGEGGLAHYRRLAEEVWDCIPPLKPGQDKDRDSDRWRITSLMKALTKDDPEAGLEVLLRDLSFSFRFLEVAEHCLKAGWHERAITWAEQGLKSFKDADRRLRSFLADRYLAADRISEAVALRWENFKEQPDLWMTLVDRLEKDHPAESLLILQEQLDAIISPMHDEAYRQAAASLSRIRSLATSLGRPGAFTTQRAEEALEAILEFRRRWAASPQKSQEALMEAQRPLVALSLARKARDPIERELLLRRGDPLVSQETKAREKVAGARPLRPRRSAGRGSAAFP